MSMNNGDDFEDDLDPAEAEAFDDEQAGDEDWDEYEDQPGEENLDDEDDSGEPPVEKKKSGAFNKILIAVAVLVVGGAVAMQLGKGTPAPSPATDLNVTAPVVQAEPAPAGMLGSDNELAKMAALAKHKAAESAAEPAPVPVATPPAIPAPPPVAPEPVSAITPKEVLNAPTPPMPASMVPAEKPIEKPAEKLAEAPAVVPAKAPESVPAVLDATPASVKTDDSATRMPSAHDMMKSSTTPDVTPAPAPTPSGNADTAALNVKMDTILSRLTSLEGEVSALKQKPDAGDQIDDLKSTVDALEKKISTMASSGSSTKTSKKAVAAIEAPQMPVSGSALPEEKPAPQILGAADNGPEANPVAGTTIKKAISKPVKVSTTWILKGAQPDQATVSKAGESDSRTVHVGDTLSGIGKITAVEYQDGRWSVVGTQGRINQ